MSTRKVVLFYVFTPLADPEAIRLWQLTLAEAHGLTGRIIVSEHGINATVGGDLGAVKKYVRGTRAYAPFARADVKWSEGDGHEFPKLSVKVRPEIVTFGAADELKVDEHGVVGGGTHLSPREVHELVEARDDVVFFDGRNAYEAAIGRFRGAVVPDVRTTRDFVGELDSGRYDHLKGKAVVTYCTGGVRCEVLSALMKARGFGEVYQIDGGIVRYGETYGDRGLWEGSLYVFDGRMSVDFGPHTVSLGECTGCGARTSRYVNDETNDRELVLVCEACS
ncbi:rhodanese-related sulfurtransferase [Rhodococcus sp. HNM0569]|uniref:oxygen-dependent tRNA uridine(34) hydroxylase TrhO n=1 Tax=Rhodococcus sp. HNM0569 TaxID=2716340 RepID=UPI00146C099E|nr:rhodanese-related sulfurtransferase [Rhodococcus sp. HNM0569]NLU84912.1 rhodanese-related sulfurtransferase [Rhodococcus sp. HNM0569]